MIDMISGWFEELIGSLGWWYIIGFIGQIVFGARFVVQWVVSERKKQSIIPIHFWYLSLTGSLLLLTYAIGRVDPVFVLGQTFNSFVYVRNLMFIRRSQKPASHGLVIK